MRAARLLWALVLSGAVVVGGLALEGVGPRAQRPLGATEAVSGAWFCPHGGGTNWRVWVVVANPTREEARMRVVTYSPGRPSAQTSSIPPGTQRYVEVPGTEMASGSAVEFFGGPVAAAMVITRPDGRGLAAEPCIDGSATRWHLPEGTTLRGLGQRLVVVNPFAAQAVFDVVLHDEEEILKPSEMSGVVLRPRRATAFSLNDFALERETLAATVEVSVGRVVAGGIGVSDGGLRASLPAAEPASTWILPGAGDDGPSTLTVFAPGGAEAPFRARVQSATSQEEVLSEGSVDEGRTASFEVDALDAGIVAESAGPEPFVAARRLVRGGDLASTGGVTAGSLTWVALPATSPDGGRALLVVENPGDEIVEGRLSLLTAGGRAEAPSISELSLAGGRTLVIPLADLVGEEPVSVLVEVEAGTLVVAQAGESGDGYSVSLGTVIGPLG